MPTGTINAYMHRPHSQLGIYSPREVMMKRSGWFDEKSALQVFSRIVVYGKYRTWLARLQE